MDIQTWAPYVSILEVILAVTLTILVLLQAKGSDLGGFLGGGSSDLGSFRTRRGVEATIYRLTIVTSIVFFINTIFAFLAWG